MHVLCNAPKTQHSFHNLFFSPTKGNSVLTGFCNHFFSTKWSSTLQVFAIVSSLPKGALLQQVFATVFSLYQRELCFNRELYFNRCCNRFFSSTKGSSALTGVCNRFFSTKSSSALKLFSTNCVLHLLKISDYLYIHPCSFAKENITHYWRFHIYKLVPGSWDMHDYFMDFIYGPV